MDDDTLETSIPTVMVMISDGSVENIIGNANVNVLICNMDAEQGDPQGFIMWEVEPSVFDDVELFHDLLNEWQALEAA